MQEDDELDENVPTEDPICSPEETIDTELEEPQRQGERQARSEDTNDEPWLDIAHACN